MTPIFPNLTNVVINCRTEKQSLELASILQKLKYKWQDGEYITQENMCWSTVGESICYNIIQGSLGSTSDFLSNGYTILTFSEFKKAFLNNRREKWEIETIFDPASKSYKFRLFKRILCFKKYLKQDNTKFELTSLEDAINLSYFLKYFKLNASVYVTETQTNH